MSSNNITNSVINDAIFQRVYNNGTVITDSDIATLKEASQCTLAAGRINDFFQKKVAPNFSQLTISPEMWKTVLQNIQKLQTAMISIMPNTKQLKPAMKVLVFSRLQERLKTLKNEPDALKAFLADVDAATKLFPAHLAPLKQALTLLLDPHAFKPGIEEELNYKDTLVNSYANIAKGELFKALQAIELKEKPSVAQIATVIEACDRDAIERRTLATLPQPTNETVKKEVEKILDLKRVKEKLSSFMDFAINGIHATYDEKSKGLFSKIIQTYSDRNLIARKPFILEQALAQYKKGVLPSKIEEKALKIFEKNYLPFYDWLLKNISHLKQAYNQGDDDSHNQGEGTCFQNSLDRLITLRKEPALNSTKIPMASSARGRFAQARVNHGAIQDEMQNVVKLLGSAPLVTPLIEPPSNLQGSKAYIADQLLALAAKKPLVGILSIQGAGGGHALNIQIDPKSQIYRLIDDNLGVVEYSSQEAFKEEISQYFTLCYPDIHSPRFLV